MHIIRDDRQKWARNLALWMDGLGLVFGSGSGSGSRSGSGSGSGSGNDVVWGPWDETAINEFPTPRMQCAFFHQIRRGSWCCKALIKH